MKKERLFELDVMRGLAFICIVLQHTIGGFSYRDDISFNDFIISKFIYIVAENGVELFIFLTAVSLIYTYYDTFDIKDFYIKKLKFLVLPFVIWSVIIMVYNGNSFNMDCILVIFSGDVQYHLWYMGMILRIYLYFPIILWIVRKIKEKNIYIKSLAFAFLAFLYWYILKHNGFSEFIIQHMFKNPTEVQKKLVNVSPMFYYFYFVIGAYAVCNYKKFKENILKHKLIVSGFYLLCFGFYYYAAVDEKYGLGIIPFSTTIVTSILYRASSLLFFYMISCIIKEKLTYIFSILKIVGKYSFPAYLIHVMVINGLTLYISTGPEIINYLKFFLFGSFISIAISYILNFLPYSEYIIGVKSKIKFNKGINDRNSQVNCN